MRGEKEKKNDMSLKIVFPVIINQLFYGQEQAINKQI